MRREKFDEEMWIFSPHFFWKENENCVQGNIFFTFTELMIGLQGYRFSSIFSKVKKNVPSQLFVIFS